MSEKATAEQMAMPKHGEFCWTEISTTNLEACQTFYQELFGWNIKKSENRGGSEVFRNYLQHLKEQMGVCGF